VQVTYRTPTLEVTSATLHIQGIATAYIVDTIAFNRSVSSQYAVRDHQIICVVDWRVTTDLFRGIQPGCAWTLTRLLLMSCIPGAGLVHFSTDLRALPSKQSGLWLCYSTCIRPKHMHRLAKFGPHRQTQCSTAFGPGPYLYTFRGMVSGTMIFETLCERRRLGRMVRWRQQSQFGKTASVMYCTMRAGNLTFLV
jgi:hypothetical protein